MRNLVHTTKWIDSNIIKGWRNNYILNQWGSISSNANYKYSYPAWVEAWTYTAVLKMSSWDRSWSRPICVNVYSEDSPSSGALLDNVFYASNGAKYAVWENNVTITVPHDWYICFGVRETSDWLSCRPS